VIDKLNAMKLKAAVRTVEQGIAETLTYTEFPREHWLFRTRSPVEATHPGASPRNLRQLSDG
jgi:putative transposase